MNVHELIANSGQPDFASILDYELGDFDDSCFLDGCQLVSPEALSHVKLYVEDSPSLPDLVGNPLSWQIVSWRLKSHLEGFIDGNDADFFPIVLKYLPKHEAVVSITISTS